MRSGEASEEDGVVWDAGVKRSSGSEVVVVVAAGGDEDDEEGRAKSWVDWSSRGMSGGKGEKHLYWVLENNSEQLCVLRMTRPSLVLEEFPRNRWILLPAYLSALIL